MISEGNCNILNIIEQDLCELALHTHGTRVV